MIQDFNFYPIIFRKAYDDALLYGIGICEIDTPNSQRALFSIYYSEFKVFYLDFLFFNLIYIEF